jgi:membrane protein YqaA with SNARE-associated domain
MTGRKDAQSRRTGQGWVRRNFVSLAVLAGALGITVVLVLARNELGAFKSWGYPGAFLIGLASNAPIGFPMPLLVLLVPMASISNPVLVGLMGGLGGATGELTAYAAGYAGRFVWHDSQAYQRAKDWVHKRGFVVVVLVGLAPLPLDPIGLAVGNLRLPAWKYLVACLPGKIVKCLGLTLFGAWGLNAFMHDSGFRLGLLAAAAGAGAASLLLILALLIERQTWK